MDIFYPADDLECFIQLASFFCVGHGRPFWLAFCGLAAPGLEGFFQSLRQFFHRKPCP